jgi:hypothetical protein
MNKIYNDDCLNVFKTIDDKMIDMVLVNLPYGQTACDWDICIDWSVYLINSPIRYG